MVGAPSLTHRALTPPVRASLRRAHGAPRARYPATSRPPAGSLCLALATGHARHTRRTRPGRVDGRWSAGYCGRPARTCAPPPLDGAQGRRHGTAHAAGLPPRMRIDNWWGVPPQPGPQRAVGQAGLPRRLRLLLRPRRLRCRRAAGVGPDRGALLAHQGRPGRHAPGARGRARPVDLPRCSGGCSPWATAMSMSSLWTSRPTYAA